MKSNLLDTISNQPVCIVGLLLVDDGPDHLHSCLDFCMGIKRDAKAPGRLIAIVDEKKGQSVRLTSHYEKNAAVDWITWRSNADSLTFASSISEIQRAQQWAIVLMGGFGRPWVESAGRLCHKTFLSISLGSNQSYPKVRREVMKLRDAGVQIAGSYVTSRAA